MGQVLDSMAQDHSRDELVYQLVNTGNVDRIKALCSEGASLEWIDSEGKTPLIVACMDSGLFDVAKVLIEMGAKVNAYRPGRRAGTPLHHAAKRGLEQTVKLLLSSGANALVMNDDCQTALDVARAKGNTNVVRAIENHICYFSGWLREFYGPGFLEAFAPFAPFLLRKIWAVVIPCGSSNPMKPIKLEFAIYLTLQDAQPRTAIALWKSNIEEPKFHQSDPGLIIFYESTKTRYKFASAHEGDKQQLYWLYDACRGIPQVLPPHQTSAEAAELATAITAYVQSAADNRPPHPNTQHSSVAINPSDWGNTVHSDGHNGWGPAVASANSAASSSGWMDEAPKGDYNGWDVPNPRPIGNEGHVQTHDNSPHVVDPSGEISASVPSAPPIPEEAPDQGPIRYPSIDFSPVDISAPAIEQEAPVTSDVKDGGDSSSCIICWEAPVEGACIPCGHMAGCMACLSEIKAKKGVCPICRTKITQVIRIYAV